MPASTPVYGFTYPCPGELVTAASFATLAGQIDTKLNDVNNDLVAALNRRNRTITGGFADVQTIPAGADTVLTIVGSTYTLPQAGVYAVTTMLNPATSPPTINVLRQRIRQNAVGRSSFTANTNNNNAHFFRASGIIVGAAADVITMAVFYSGTGTMDVRAAITVKMLCRIA